MHTTVVILVALCSWSNAYFYEALSDMEILLDTYRYSIDIYQKYVDKEISRHKILKYYLKHYKAEHAIATTDISSYLEDPVNCFTFIKRLTVDLDYLEKTVNSSKFLMDPSIRYPAREDFFGAAQSLAQLHNTYRLKVTDLANGIINSTFSHDKKVYTEIVEPMSASDCFETAVALFKEQDYENALSWMLEAYAKYPSEKKERYPFNMADILENIGYAYHALDDLKNALVWMKKWLALRPSEQFVKSYVHYHETLFKAQKELKELHNIPDQNKPKKKNKVLEESLAAHRHFHAVCRGEMKISMEVMKKLKCRYLKKHHAFLKLAPIKMEQLYLKPDVTMFYEVMSNSEIEHLKFIARPLLQPTVISVEEPVANPYRISKVAWFLDQESSVVARVSQRVSDLTGFTMEGAERLQICNYGVGGHFVPHEDYIKMSDVAQGGATVFTQLGLTVFPVRGAALYWRNLHPSGEVDLSTEHAGCPVLRGDKWVAVKWIHNLGQVFRKPCSLQPEKISDGPRLYSGWGELPYK